MRVNTFNGCSRINASHKIHSSLFIFVSPQSVSLRLKTQLADERLEDYKLQPESITGNYITSFGGFNVSM